MRFIRFVLKHHKAVTAVLLVGIAVKLGISAVREMPPEHLLMILLAWIVESPFRSSAHD